jgi:hypothetical protein
MCMEQTSARERYHIGFLSDDNWVPLSAAHAMFLQQNSNQAGYRRIGVFVRAKIFSFQMCTKLWWRKPWHRNRQHDLKKRHLRAEFTFNGTCVGRRVVNYAVPVPRPFISPPCTSYIHTNSFLAIFMIIRSIPCLTQERSWCKQIGWWPITFRPPHDWRETGTRMSTWCAFTRNSTIICHFSAVYWSGIIETTVLRLVYFLWIY